MPANTSTSSATHRTYSFGEFTLDLDRGALLKAGADIKLRPKSFEMLSYLVERHGLLVAKNELLDALWGRTVVSEDAVNQCVTDIRRALRDQSQKTIRRSQNEAISSTFRLKRMAARARGQIHRLAGRSH